MADNVFERLDPLPSTAGKVEGSQPNVFEQLDPRPAQPATASPAPAPTSVAATLGRDPTAGDYPPGSQPQPSGTIQDQVQQAQQASQQAPAAQQVQTAPTPQAQTGAQQPTQPAQAGGQAQPQDPRQAKIEQATKPPNLAESAIPQPVSPNPPPPQVAPAESPQQAAQAVGLQNPGATTTSGVDPAKAVLGDDMTDSEEVGGEPLPAGATRDANGIVHNPDVPHWLDTLMSWSQAGGNAVQQTGAALSKDIQTKGATERAAVGAGYGLVGRWGANVIKATGQNLAGLSHLLPDLGSRQQAMEAASLTGDMEAYKALSKQTDEEYRENFNHLKEALPAFGAFDVERRGGEEAGHAITEYGQQSSNIVGDWAKQHGVDPEKLAAIGPHASLAGITATAGEQLPLLAVSGGIGGAGSKIAVRSLEYVDPELMAAAAKGSPLALEAVKRVTTLSATIPSISFQTAYIAGVSGTEAAERVKKTSFKELGEQNPEFLEAMKRGDNPEELREDLSMRAGYRAQAGAIVSMAAASTLAPAVDLVKGKIGEKATQMLTGGVNNALLQGSLQASSNYGMQLANPNQKIMQGVLPQAAGGFVIGNLLGMVGGGDESPVGRTKEQVAADNAAIKRGELKTRTEAGLDKNISNKEDIHAKADQAEQYRKEGKLYHAGGAVGVNVTPATNVKPNQAPTLDTGKEAAKDALKSYIAAPNEDKKLGPVNNRLMKISALDRWSQLDGGRSPDEYQSAARKLTATGELPQEITERVGNDFNMDGTLSNAALHNDIRLNPDSSILHARVPEEQREAVVQTLRNAGVNPYVTDRGDITVLGDKDTLGTMQEALAKAHEGTNFTVTENHYGPSLEQHTAPAQDQGQPSETENAKDAEGVGPSAEGSGPRADEAAQAVTARSQPVIDRLKEEGLAPPVSGDGRVTVHPNTPDSERITDIAANDAAESPENDRKIPTTKQKKEGNYPKGKVLFASPKGNVKFNNENPRGSIRKDVNGKWQRKMTLHYGYFPGTHSADGEGVDGFAGPKAHDDSLPIFIMQQTKMDGSFDEHKVVMGARSEREARSMYLSQYPASLHDKLLQGTTKMVRMSREQFVRWLDSGDHDVPIHPMSKQPMLKLREPPGKLESRFSEGTPYDKLDSLSEAINNKHKTNLEVRADGKGYKLVGDVPKAKVPSIHRTLQRAEGHEQTDYNGNPASEVYAGAGRKGGAELRVSPETRGARPEVRGRSDRGEPAGTVPARPGVGPDSQGNAKAPKGPSWLNRPSSDAPAYVGNRGGKNPVSVVGVHYSGKSGLESIDSSFAGTGSMGAERRRYGMGRPTSDEDHRLFYYVRQSRELPEKESVVSGTHAYETQLNNLYDVRKDPDGIFDRLEKAGTTDADSVNEAIRKAGYDGMVMPGVANDTPVAMLVGPHNVPAKEVSGERFIFGGVKAQIPPEGLPKAKEMYAKEVDENAPEKEQRPAKDRIHTETGWHKGSDGKWRFEIDDSQSTLRPAEEWQKDAEGEGAPIERVLDHPELYKQYPNLKDYKVLVRKEYDGIELSPGEGLNDWHEKKLVFTDPADYKGSLEQVGKARYSLRSVITHELEHGVQMTEAFARGGSPDEFSFKLNLKVQHMQNRIADLETELYGKIDRGEMSEDRANDEYTRRFQELMDEAKAGGFYDKNQLAMTAFRFYERLGGEVYARNAQKRLNYSAAKRREKSPFETQEFQNDEHINAQPGQGAELPQKSANRPDERRDEDSRFALPGAQARGLRGRGGVSGSEGPLEEPRRSAPTPALEGLPSRVKVNGEVRTFGPHEPAHEAARAYAKESGIEYKRPTAYTKVNEARAKRIAQAYEEMQHAPNDPAVKKAYRKMIDETMAQWQAIKKTGLKVEFIKPGEAYPYKNPREVHQDVIENNHMWVYPTTEGFGGSESAHVDISGNPLLEPTGESVGGHPTVANDIFRIVHDYFGHIKEGVGFRAEGEENAWRAHAAMYSPLARRAMTTETRGQNSWVNYGPYGEFNKTASGEDTQYAPQKVGLLPDWVSHEGRTEAYSPEEAKAHVDEIQTHLDGLRESWSNGPDVHVVADRHELPESVAKHLDKALGGADAQGTYYGGKVYVIGSEIADKPHAELVLTHEALGHFGLNKTFGPALDNLLSEIHESVKDTPEFKSLASRYADAYSGMGLRERELAYTEEYLSDRAVLSDNRSALAKVTGWVRRWGRQMGMTRDWSQNDILSLMSGVSQNVREGKVSRQGWPTNTTTFDDEQERATTTYDGAAGIGEITTRRDGSRDLAIGDLKASVSRVLNDDGIGMLVGKVKYSDPRQLLSVTRLAGEEAKSYVLWPKEAEADLKSVGIPTERVGEKVLTPASKVGEQEARFSLKNQIGDKDLRDRIDRVMGKPESDMSIWDRFQQFGRSLAKYDTWAHWGNRFIQQNVDRFVPIANASMQMHGGTLLDASQDAYKMANMSQNTREVMGGVMKLGVPGYVNGSFEAVAGRKGLMDILMPLYQHQEKGFDRMWEFYAMARRGDQLSGMTNPDGTSKEKLLTDEDIKAGLALGEKYPVMKKVFDDWQDFNKQLLDLAVERGNMTKEMADLWKQNDYVPFYRVSGDEDIAPLGKMPGGMQVSSKRLTGSNRQVEPIIENIVNNSMAVLRKVYRNEALRRSVALGENIGAVERMPTQFRPVRMSVAEIEKNLEKMGLFVGQQSATLNQGATRGAKVNSGGPNLRITPEQADRWTAFFRAQEPLGKDAVSVMENGKPIYYRVNDPDYLQALNSIKSQQQLEGWFTKVFGAPKNWLTHLITLNPAFMLRHLERQATHTWVQSGENFNPMSHALENAKDAYTNSEFMQKMAVAGAGGNEYYDIDQLRESMRGLGVHSTVLDTGHKVWMAYRKIGFVADQMNRMGIAKSVLARGGSTAEAAWQAQDLLNFRMHGDGTLMRHLIAAVPFLNARIQGMYRIARGAAGIDQSFKSRQRSVISFLVKSATLIAASQMLALKNNGDERYERLPDEAKDLYWHIFVGNHHFAIAKPFELGAIFSTIPDRAVRYAEGLDGSHTFKAALWRAWDTIFRFDPTPALLNPAVQDWKNKDDLTQRPIVPANLQSVDPRQQFNPYTSPSVKAVAQAMPEFAPDIMRSPLRLQHLVDGYVGTLGEYAINAADIAVRHSGMAPAGPASRSGAGTLVDTAFGSMAGRVDTDPRNRYSSMIFEQKKELDQIATTIKSLQRANDAEELDRYYMKHKTLMQYKGEIMNGYRTMEDFRKEQQAIYSSTTMTPQEKREQLDEITKQQNAFLDQMAPILNMADNEL